MRRSNEQSARQKLLKRSITRKLQPKTTVISGATIGNGLASVKGIPAEALITPKGSGEALSLVNNGRLSAAKYTAIGGATNIISGGGTSGSTDSGTGTGDTETNFVRWRGRWQRTTYSSQDMVVDESWAMIANKQTEDRAAPIELGGPENAIEEGTVYETHTDPGYVTTGNIFTTTQAGWVTGWDVLIPEIDPEIHYQLYASEIIGGEKFLLGNLVLPATVQTPGWFGLDTAPFPCPVGTIIEIGIIATNTADEITVVNSPWAFNESPKNDPLSGEWSTNNQQDVVRINRYDSNATDRYTNLENIVMGDLLTISTTNAQGTTTWQWRIEGAGNYDAGGEFFEFDAQGIETSGSFDSGDTCTILATRAGTAPTAYTMYPDLWASPSLHPTWGTAVGFINASATAHEENLNGYMASIEFQAATVSEDWDFLALSAIEGGSGGGADGGMTQHFIDGEYHVLENGVLGHVLRVNGPNSFDMERLNLSDLTIVDGPGLNIADNTISADVDPDGGIGYNAEEPYRLRLEAPTNVSTTSGNDIGTGHSHAAEWTSDGLNNPEVLLGADDTGGLLLSNIEAADQITTPEIAAKNNLLINPVGYAHMDKVLRSTGYDPGLNGAMINFATGDADIRNLEVSSLIADTFIARAKYANVQGEWWGKSASQSTRPFKIPVAGSSETFYIADIPGLTGFQAFEDDDFLFLPFMEFASTETNVPSFYGVDFSATKLSDVAAGPAELYSNDFEGDTVGQEPPDWYSTAANAPDSELPDLFTVMDDAGNNTFGTTSTVANTHTNFSGTNHKTLSNYTFTGRFKKTAADGGIGFTLYSQYWPGGEDGYYRIRQYGGHPNFEANHHGDAQISGGVSQSSFAPAINTWYRFKIEIESVTGQVNLRGRFWEDGAQEPATWDIDCYDSSANRYTQGTFGFWNYGTGTKYYDDLLVETTGGSELQSTLSFDTSSYPVGAFLMIVAQIPDDRSGVSLPSGWGTTNYSGSPDSQVVLWRTKAAGDDTTVNITVTDPTRDMFASMISVLDTTGYAYYGILYNEGTFTPPVGWEPATAMAAVNIGIGTGYAAAITNLAGKGNEYYTLDEGYASDSNSKGFFSVIPGGVTSSTYTVSKTDTVGDHFTIFLGVTGSPAGTTGAAIGQAVGQITRVYPDDLEDEEQAYNWITVNNSPGQGITVSADARVVDMGVSGQGYMEVSTVGSSRPWMRSAVWSGIDPLNGTTRTTAIMGNVAGLTGSATPEYGFWAGENDQYIQATDTVFETRNLPFNSYGTDGKLKVVISAAGNVAFGRDVEAGVRGFYYNQASGNVTIGDPNGDRVHWEQDANGAGGVLTVTGSLTVAPGTQVPWSDVTGPFDDIFNDDVTWDDLGTSRPDDDDLLNDRQVWDDVQDLPPLIGYTDVQDPPGTLGAGLYMNAWYMGYWSPVHGWQTYMQNNGNFMFRSAGSTNNRLEWDGTKLAGYDSGNVTQFYLSATDGKAYAGGGVVQMDADGLRIQNGYGENNRISFYSTTDSNSEFATIRAEGSQASGFVSFGVNNANQTALRINYDDNATGSTGASFGPLTGYFEIDTPNMTVTGNIQSNAGVIAGGLLQAHNGVFFDIDTLPTTDPGVRGLVWRSGNDLRISTG